MADIPIIFSGAMVRALLDGRKTMTRRLAWSDWRTCKKCNGGGNCPYCEGVGEIRAPANWRKVRPGDRLWVREKIHVRPIASAMHAYSYADEEDPNMLGGWKKVRLLPHDHKVKRPERAVWRPSIHMPREFSRLTLIVTSTKVERLQDISEDDAQAEGVERAIAGNGPSGVITTYRTGFVYTWGVLHGTDSWLTNPKVVALTFTVHKQNIDTLAKAQAA